jgi:hypothetical protein
MLFELEIKQGYTMMHGQPIIKICMLLVFEKFCERDHYVHFLLYVIKFQQNLLYFLHNPNTTK